MLPTDAARRQLASFGCVHPKAASKPAPKIAPYTTSEAPACSIYAPLSMIALRNRPFAVVVEARLLETIRPPADSPPTVTLLASPPQPAMLRCTHCRANC